MQLQVTGELRGYSHWILLFIALSCRAQFSQAAIEIPEATMLPAPAQAARLASRQKLDGLFLQLQQAENEAQARVIETAIWEHWFRSDNQVIVSLMGEAMRARRESDYEKAIELLTTVIVSYPDYSEAWNQRATIYFLIGDDEASLIDIAETLAREPRHFGALAGRAMIRSKQGKPVLAKNNLREAVKIHPFLRDRHLLGD